MAQVDYFLKIDGVEGESSDSKHKGEIDIESFSWGATNTGSHSHGSGGGAGKVTFQDIHFTTKVNKASPKLMLSCATGKHLPSSLLTVRKAGGDQQEYYQIKLTDCLISSYQSGGHAGGDVIPTDQFSINFSKIEFDYKEQKPDGTLAAAVKAGYDLAANKKV